MGADATRDQAFAHANDLLKNAVGGIVNVESEPCKAMMGTAVASGPDRATQAAEVVVPARCWKASA